jgi:hypothetical protein
MTAYMAVLKADHSAKVSLKNMLNCKKSEKMRKSTPFLMQQLPP